MARKSTSKRQRFEIFKRDNFTCQYCGAQPPEVVLVIDHVLPVVEGGDNDQTNLITACEPCNQGKAGKLLGNVAPRPDADLEYLQMQQELAELRRYQLVRKERDTLITGIAIDLADSFVQLSSAYLDTDVVATEIIKMLSKSSPEFVEEALASTARKVAGGYLYTSDWKPYTYGILKNMERERR